MLGKVHGPYQGKAGRQFVVVILHNDDGTIKERKTIPYSLYLEEKDEGGHQYEEWLRPQFTPNWFKIAKAILSGCENWFKTDYVVIDLKTEYLRMNKG